MPDVSQFDSYARLLRLTPVRDIVIAPIYQSSTLPSPPTRRSWLPKSIASLIVLCVLPTITVSCYFWLFAAPRYESEARFVLRVPGRIMVAPQQSQMSAMLQDAGVNRSSDDGYIVQDFLESRDAFAFLEAQAGFRDAVSIAKNDPLWSYPGFLRSDNQERLYKYYKRLVSVTFDNTTGVSTLKVQAFSPIDARRQGEVLLTAAENLVNRLNERSRLDAISLAEGEENRARLKVLATQHAVTEFRERERMVDPGQVTIAVLEAIAKLSLEATQVSVQISELMQASPNGPQIAPLRNRRAALEAQIALERAKLAGDAQSIAPRIAEYERLMLEREFADKALIASMSGVEMTRLEASRKQIYLERVARPGQPDYPAYPWRVFWSLLSAGAGYLSWRIWQVLSVNARRHAEL